MGSRGRSSHGYQREIILSEDDANHILDRHSASSQYPGKTKFPVNWSSEDIISAVEKTLDKPDRVIYPIPPNSRYQIESDFSGVTVRVSYFYENGKAIFHSAYPLP
jgi:hypothetical protein